MSSSPENRPPFAVVQVPPPELRRRLDDGVPLVLLDVREPFERDLCRIEPPPGTVDLLIPLGELPARLDELEDAARGLPVIVYCHHGVRSLMAARWLAARGFRCGNLTGGIDAWADQVEPGMGRY